MNPAAFSGDDCRLLVSSVVDYAIYMLDPSGRVMTWNRGAEQINGYGADEIVGQHFSKFYPPEDVAAGKPESELIAAAKNGRIEDEGWRLRKDGTRLWANEIITALRDEGGNLRGYGKVIRDLTARRAADDELRRAEQKFHLLVDSVIDYAIFILDTDGTISTWNAGARRVKGYTAEEIIGQHFSVFYTAEDRAVGKPARILDTVRREGRYEDESWRVRKDGSRFWANVVITALRDPSGELIGFAKVTRDLSDRQRTEEQLRRSEERARLLVENVADYAIYMLDEEGRVTSWNLGAERMKGYLSEEILGQSFAVFFPAEDIAAGKPFRELAMARALGRYEDEGWRIRRDGTRFWANAVLTAIHDPAGELIGFAKITRDLTSRRQAEATERQLLREQTAREVAQESERRVRESEKRYRALSQRLEIIFEGVADGITVQERSGRLVFANRAAARICGFDSVDQMLRASPEEVLSRFDTRDEHGRPMTAERLPGRRALAGEVNASALYHVRERATHREWWSAVRATAVAGANGEPELAVNIWHDVTAERRQESQSQYLAAATSALGGSLDQTQMLTSLAAILVPGLGDWCSVFLRQGDDVRNVTVAHADPSKTAIAEHYRQSFSPALDGHSAISRVLISGQSELFNDITDEMLAQSAHSAEHLELLRAVGMKAALLVPVRMRDRVVGVLSLVSAESARRYDANHRALVEELGRRAGVALENAQLYRAAQDAARAAEEASRAKDEFLATVSHELRTPLTAILGWAALLKERATDPALAKPLTTILRNAKAQAKIVDDILDVSRVITGKLRLDLARTDLVTIARDAIEVIRPSAEAKHIDIALISNLALCPLLADAARLQQVVWNLLSNAVKFSEPGGRIDVHIDDDGGACVLKVCDNGHGIDPAFLPKVFDRFVQADSSLTRKVGGLGLGLALVRHIVELHGGTASVASEGLEKGATLTIRLPRSTSSSSTSRRHEPPRAEPLQRLDGVRVLAVEDEADTRDLIAATLTQSGAVVETAASAAEAFELLQRVRPHVLLSDIGMAGEDGFAFMRRIRALPSHAGGAIPALALTAFVRAEDSAEALRAGFNLHVGKPVDPPVLVAAIAQLAELTRRH